jgi:hypothetical protein
MLRFFNTTSIHKEVGLYSVTSKKFAAEGYNDDWNFYQLHHVCVKGGSDGIYTGYDDSDENQLTDSENYISVSTWDKIVSDGEAFPLLSKKLDSNVVHKTKLFRGSTILMKCQSEGTRSVTAFRDLMKMGFAYELARTFNINKERA